MFKPDWRWLIAIPGVFFLAFAAHHVYHHDPSIYGGPFLPCVFLELTGLWCPGCGATRAVYALMHLDLAGALRMNAFLVLVGFPALALALVNHFGPRRVLTLKMEARVYAVFFLLAMLFMVLRNLPFAPFTILAPH